MKTILIFALFILIPISLLLSQAHDNLETGARSAGLGLCNTTFTDIFSAHHNQAGLGFLEKSGVAVYASNRYFVEGVNLFAGVAALSTSSGTFGLDLSYYGFEAYNETKIGLGYGRKLAEKFSVGIQLDYFSTRINEYGSASTFSVEMGLLYFINEEVRVGAHYFNPFQSRIGEINESVPSNLKLGISIDPSERVTLMVDAKMDLRQDISIRGGIEYKPSEWIHIRGGFSTAPIQYTIGTGIQFDGFRMDFASSIHQQLGISPHFGLIYQFSKK